jgi:hypothetical protein
MDDLIAAAIGQRRLLKLAYTAGNRIVEPYIYGLDGKSRELLRCYQLAGESASRERAGWKLLRAGDVAGVEVLDVRFEPRAGYTAGDPAIGNVYARLKHGGALWPSAPPRWPLRSAGTAAPTAPHFSAPV